MSYAPPGMYAWDFWLVPHDGLVHLFHLQAPRRLPAPLRHEHATVGHAVSRDLITWEPRGTVLEPGPAGAWDDRCIWTGSILPWRGRFWFLYTGRCQRAFLVQRIGVAVSDDLEHFEKHPANPILRADPRWYQTAADGLPVEDWRDPHLFVHQDRLCALITARSCIPEGTGRWELRLEALREAIFTAAPFGLDTVFLPRGPLAGRGCIALASSVDGISWEVGPPLLLPGDRATLECPQLTWHKDRWYLTFVSLAGWTSRRSGAPARSGLYAWHAPALRGPWAPLNGDGWIEGQPPHAYGTRILAWPESPSGLVAVPWMVKEPLQRGFSGRIGAPASLWLEGDRGWMTETERDTPTLS